jgi:uncharacterized FlgJ-related protein
MIYVYNKRTLSFKPVIRRLFFFSIITSIACIISAYAYGYFKGFDTGASTITDIERSILIKESDKFSEEKLKEYLLQLNIKFPHIVYAQAVLETGNFKSHVFQNNQNLFGMKQARIRATTNQGTELGHAVYNHWRESVVDYALYQCAFLLKVRSEEAYYQYLSENYAENPDYVSKIKTLAEKFKTRTK